MLRTQSDRGRQIASGKPDARTRTDAVTTITRVRTRATTSQSARGFEKVNERPHRRHQSRGAEHIARRGVESPGIRDRNRRKGNFFRARNHPDDPSTDSGFAPIA